MAGENLKESMRRYYDEIWGKGNLSLSELLVAADFVDHMAFPDQPPGRAGHDQTVAMIRSAFPDAVFDIADLVAEDDRVVDRWVMRATHRGPIMGIPATGKSVTMTGMDFTRWENGKLAEIWHIEDILGMLQELGAVPGPRN